VDYSFPSRINEPAGSFRKPDADEVAAFLNACFPALGVETVSFLNEGWASWVFEAGDILVRVPKREYVVRSHQKERRLLPALSRQLPWPVPVHEYCCDDGPNGRPFTGYKRIPGVPLSDLDPCSAPGLGGELGAFLRALHDFPGGEAAALGVPYHDPARWREGYRGFFEDIVRTIFPLLGCESRSLTEELFDTYLGDDANFRFTPSLIHYDLGPEHLLVDPETRRLTGVIDFEDCVVGDTAGDLSWPLHRFAEIAGAEAVEALRDAYGREAIAALEPRTDFYRRQWPYHTIIYGLEVGDATYVEEGIAALNQQAYEGRVQCR
jgi:aminoglycoside 2''-phosphotransferase